MLADQSAGRARGTGRYTRAMLAELLRETTHEWFLYYHGEAGDATFTSPHVTERTLPDQASLHVGIENLARVNPHEVDVLLLTCPLENFQGYLPPFSSRRGPRLAALVYDLIPLRFPDQYLHHRGIAQSYRRALAALRHYDLLLTISESGRQDVIELLGVAPRRVTNIGAGCDDGFFCPHSSQTPDSGAVRWLSCQGIGERFIYALTALDYRKNLSGLLAAFERLPARLLDSHQLVMTCAGSGPDDARQARLAIERSPAARRIVLTGPLDDVGLRTLYQRTAAFVFPSRYEGFGLPLLEAMRCGAPVVAGKNSSQIEVVGEAGLLADVDDAEDVTAKICKLLDSPELSRHLRARAVEQSRRFTWPAVAARCLAALETAVDRPRQAAWFDSLAARGKLALESRLQRYTSLGRRATA